MTHMRDVVVAALIAALTLVSGLRLRAANHPAFMIGVLNSNGVLDPLLTYDGTRWDAPWPDRASPPDSMALIPKAWWGGFSGDGWHIPLSVGDRPLRLLRPIVGDRDCGNGVALQTDYVHPWPVSPGLQEWVGIASTGPVQIRQVSKSSPLGDFDLSDRDREAAERRLTDVLRLMKRPTAGLTTNLVARIPRSDGSDVWEIESLGPRRFVRLWASDGPSQPFLLFKDEVADPDGELIGSLTPIGVIADLDPTTIVAWEQGFDGGTFVVLRITSDGVDFLMTVGGFSC